VFTFLRVRTFLDMDNAAAAEEIVKDSMALGKMEGLFAHASSARMRLTVPQGVKSDGILQ
jgi:hypothetical protein